MMSTAKPARPPATGGRTRSADANDALDQVFKALAHRTRRAQLALLARGPAMVTQLAEPFAMSLPAASKHLRVLENAGLVARDIEGRVHRCSLNAEPLRNAQEWLEHYRVFWGDTLDALARYVETDDRADDSREGQ